jgi:MFS family permease
MLRYRSVVIALSSAGLVAAVMQTLVMPLIPELPELVHASASDASWVITATLLSAAVCTPVSGRLGDMFGKRRILLITLGLLLAAVVIFPVWGLYELRRRGPLVDLRISSRRPVLLTNLASVMVGFAMYASVMILPQLLQAPKRSGFGLGQSMVMAGLCMAPSGLVMLLASPLSARLTASRDARTTLMIGTAILGLAYLVAPWLMSSPLQLVVVSLITGCGMALAYSAMPTLIMQSVPDNETAAANGLNALMRSLGTSISSAVLAVLLASTLRTASSAGPISSAASSSGHRQFQIAFLIAAGAALVGTVLTLFLPSLRGPSREAEATLVEAQETDSPISLVSR